MVMALLTRRAEGPKLLSPTRVRFTRLPARAGSNPIVSGPGWLTSSLALSIAERRLGARSGSAAVPAWAWSTGLELPARVTTRYTAGAKRSSRASRAGRNRRPARPACGRRLALARETFGDMRGLLWGSGPAGKHQTIPAARRPGAGAAPGRRGLA